MFPNATVGHGPNELWGGVSVAINSLIVVTHSDYRRLGGQLIYQLDFELSEVLQLVYEDLLELGDGVGIANEPLNDSVDDINESDGVVVVAGLKKCIDRLILFEPLHRPLDGCFRYGPSEK